MRKKYELSRYGKICREMSSQSKLNKAFRALRKAGYFARQDFWCCQTCGWADVPEGRENKVVFYHHQDTESKNNGQPFYVSWSGDGFEICRIFEDNGITAIWAGNNETRIQLSNY